MGASEQFNDKHLLVFGMGYLGLRVARQALSKCMRVTGLTRSVEKAENLRAEGFTMIVADMVERRWYPEVIEPVDYVLNCISAGGGGVDGYVRTYIEGMHSLLQWCAQSFRGRLVYTSSTGVYPFSEGELISEDTEFEPQSETSRILLGAEGLLMTAGQPGWTILRLAGIYGPERHYLLNQVLSGESELPGEGEVYLNLIRVEDICSAIWKIWQADEPVLNSIYNVADDQPGLKREVVAWLAEKTGQPTPTFNPAKSIRQRHLPNGKLPHRIISNSKLKQATGWKPEFRTYREGFADLVE
jgi:nucleoside-diphosphate-sugar epimerase